MTAADINAAKQSNAFCVKSGSTYGIELGGTDPGAIAKLADIINQIITMMENYKDDNGKYAGVSGAKKIIAPNDARLKAALSTALSMDMFQGYGPNPAYQRATLEDTPYLRDLSCCFNGGKGVGFFITDPAYNAENHGPEFTERVALTLHVDETKNPYGISYDARQRFDINVASWRGIVFVYIGSAAPDFIENGFSALTEVEPIATIVKPVSVVGTVTTTTSST
jgi:hypothetical protein